MARQRHALKKGSGGTSSVASFFASFVAERERSTSGEGAPGLVESHRSLEPTRALMHGRHGLPPPVPGSDFSKSAKIEGALG